MTERPGFPCRTSLKRGRGDSISRRDFLLGATALAVPRWESPGLFPNGDIRFGCAAITWGGNDRNAIEDIASAGFRGIQLRNSAVDEWGGRPEELTDLLAAHQLTFVALSSGIVRIDPEFEAEDIDLHLKHASFLRKCGGLYLQVIDERPKGRPVVSGDYTYMGGLLTELGKRTADLGISLGYHNHMGALGEKPDEVDRVLAASDPNYVHLELDTAHFLQAGGEPARAVEQYANRLLFLHLKDLESPVAGEPRNYRFVELGRGKVDFKEFFGSLARVRFKGWAIVELDRVTDESRTAKDSANLSKRYLTETLGLRV